MKSIIDELKGLMVRVMQVLCILPAVALADIPPPPEPLHRIGFEIFGKASEKNEQPKPVKLANVAQDWRMDFRGRKAYADLSFPSCHLPCFGGLTFGGA